MTDRYLSKSEVAAFFGVSARAVDYWVEDGKLPKPDRTPGGRPRWLESVVRAAGNRARENSTDTQPQAA